MKRDRDRSIDHLLRDALEASTSDGGACLDAETAAAFVDDTLGRVERSEAVAHAAGCSRCQVLLASVAKTNPPVSTASWWRVPSAGWLAPLSAAAAGAIVWAVLPQLTKPQPAGPMPGVSRVESARPASASPSPPPERRLDPAPEKRASRQDAAASASSTVATPATPSTEAAAAPPPAPRTLQAANMERDAAAIDTKTTRLAAAKVEDAAGAPAASTVPLTAPSPGVSAPAVFRSQSAARQNGLLALSESIAKVEPLIVSPDGASRWRVVAGGGVEHSTDAGTTWERQQTGVTVALRAGASTSPSTCWIVGGAGTVLLSTDGRTWRRVAFPETADLVSIRAADERSATVTSSDGRSFVTKDGGVTWVRVPGA